jgi:hypothetical protein
MLEEQSVVQHSPWGTIPKIQLVETDRYTGETLNKAVTLTPVGRRMAQVLMSEEERKGHNLRSDGRHIGPLWFRMRGAIAVVSMIEERMMVGVQVFELVWMTGYFVSARSVQYGQIRSRLPIENCQH